VTASGCCKADSVRPGCRASGVRVATGGPHSPILRQGLRRIVEWGIPGGVLVLLPKCPMCLAAYLAIGTGIGISTSAATYMRWIVLSLCISSLTYLGATHGRRIFAWILAYCVQEFGKMQRQATSSQSGYPSVT
jgi:hypothetical protein